MENPENKWRFLAGKIIYSYIYWLGGLEHGFFDFPFSSEEWFIDQLKHYIALFMEYGFVFLRLYMVHIFNTHLKNEDSEGNFSLRVNTILDNVLYHKF